MGWIVLGFGNIDVDEKYMQEILDMMIGDKKKVVERLVGENVGNDFYDVEATNGNITFKMEGNKSIDYAKLDAIKAHCINAGIGIEISVTEYIEGDEGYYYNSVDEAEEV